MPSIDVAERVALLAGLLSILIVVCLWLALKRIRRWKEQILHATAVLQSNTQQEHLASRAAVESTLEHVRRQQDELKQELAPIREELRSWRNQVQEVIGGNRGVPQLEEIVASNYRYDEYVEFLRALDHATDGSRSYLSIHLHRTARTLAAVPAPVGAGRALELGAYGFMAAALGLVTGYREVKCAYHGAAGQQISRPVSSKGEEIFLCDFDLYDAERDPFPYPDGHFELVLACEIIEHLTRDPMHMLVECARVLVDGGTLLLTTPNITSYSSIAKVLTAESSPQIYSLYPCPTVDTESPHIREYAPRELCDAVVAAGFTVEYVFTEKIAGCDADRWVAGLLRHLAMPTALRGEQLYCIARKQRGAGITRYPAFLYES